MYDLFTKPFVKYSTRMTNNFHFVVRKDYEASLYIFIYENTEVSLMKIQKYFDTLQ